MTGRPSGRCAATEALEQMHEALWMYREHFGHIINQETGEHQTQGCPGCFAEPLLRSRSEALVSPCCVTADQRLLSVENTEKLRKAHRIVVEADVLASERNIGRTDYRLNKIEDTLARAVLILLALLDGNEQEER